MASLYQFELDHRFIDCGMFYAVRCEDGSFFLIDSAHQNSVYDHVRIHDFLRSLTPEGQKIKIAGWFFSHAHQDHIVKFMDFIRSDFNDYEIEALYYNFPDPDGKSSEYWKPDDRVTMREFVALMNERKDLKKITLHTGDVFNINELKFSVLVTYEDIFPMEIERFNDTSVVLMMETAGQKVFFPGDAGELESDFLVEHYGDGLKSDILQLSHHGFRGGTVALYEKVNAPVVLISTSQVNLEKNIQRDTTSFAINNAKEVYVAGNGTVKLDLPYEPGKATVFDQEINYPFFEREALMQEIDECAEEIVSKIELSDTKKTLELKKMFKKCFLNTAETTLKEDSHGSPFIITGDIPAMWLRDSACQVAHYLPFIKDHPNMQKMVKALIFRQYMYILHDRYANAFMESDESVAKYHDKTDAGKMVWERKFELDSLCWPLWLLHKYIEATNDKTVLTKQIYDGLLATVEVCETELDHNNSKYTFVRENCRQSDTLLRNGKGPEFAPTGMIWQAFRPSDDACMYSYHVPSAFMALTVLEYAEEIMKDYSDADTAKKIAGIREGIKSGIEKYAKVNLDDFGEVYSYETDGLGNHNLMDDANVPSLLAMPLFDNSLSRDETYINTRRFILSDKNPYYFKGTKAQGVGSQHTEKGFIWPIGIIVEALTSDDRAVKMEKLDLLMNTTANTGFMHESFHKDDDMNYTRSWFAWANSFFALFIEKLFA